MIPRDYITEWRSSAPWVSDFQVEQDLVICRALVDIFTHPVLRESLTFRGGTALYKLYLKPAARYSEDIDLVQVRAGPAGAIMDALRDVLNPWLGEARWKQSEGRLTFNYRFLSEDPTPVPLRLKVEINTREHFTQHGLQQVPFSVSSRWFDGACEINTYDLDELLGTKLRALYQRRKGRDLFDISTALTQGNVDPTRIVSAFNRYMSEEGHNVTRTLFEENLAIKLENPRFLSDIPPLLSGKQNWNAQKAHAIVVEKLCSLLDDRLGTAITVPLPGPKKRVTPITGVVPKVQNPPPRQGRKL